jgi:O-antigen ligase
LDKDRFEFAMNWERYRRGVKWALQLAPFMALLFILPFPGTVALRLTCLGAAFLVAIVVWRRLAPPPFPCKWAIALWAGVVVSSLVYAVDFPYSLGEVKNEIGYTLLAFVAFLVWTRDEKRLRFLCMALLAGFLVISLSALVGAYLRGGEWPPYAFYGHVGTVSSYLVTVAPLLALAVAFLCGRRHAAKGLALAGLLFLAVAILAAQRALWPAVAMQLALAGVWFWTTRPAVGLVRLALGGAVLLVLIVGGVLLSDRLRTGGDAESPVAMENDLRPRVWRDVSEEILAHPLTGAGFGRRALAKAYPDRVPPENPVFWHAHNLVLNYGISAGAPGMAAVLILFAALAWRFWQLALFAEPLARLTGLAGAAMVVGVFTRNMANDFFVRDGSLLFWALAGMLFGYALRHESPGAAQQKTIGP